MSKKRQFQRKKQKSSSLAYWTANGSGGVYVERKFDIGRRLDISDRIKEKGVQWLPLLTRHAAKDWGDDIPDEDRAANDEECRHTGHRIYDWYNTPQGRVMIVSEVGIETRILMADEW